MEPPPARRLKPGHPHRNVQKIHMNFYLIEVELHVLLCNSLEGFTLFWGITFSKIPNYNTGWPRLGPLAVGGSMSRCFVKIF